jgi:hypothetical protein
MSRSLIFAGHTTKSRGMKSEWNSDPTSPDRPTAGVNVPINKGTLTWDPEHPPRGLAERPQSVAHLPEGPRDSARRLVSLRRSGHRPQLIPPTDLRSSVAPQEKGDSEVNHVT